MLPRVRKVNLHPPALDPGDEEGEDEIIPWVLLENTAYVADRRNATTAFSDCRGYDGTIQASLFVARPPRLSYICVFYRSRRLQFQIGEEPLQQQQQQQEGEEQMIPITPKVIATDESLVLLGIELGDRDVGAIQDMYVYQPGGGGGGGDGGPPLLTRLQRIPCRYMFRASDVGLVSCSNSYSSYMVAVLCPMDHLDVKRSMMGQFILCLYDSELRTWTPTTVSVDDQTFQKYQEEGYFVHLNTKAIAAGRGGGGGGGEHASATMAFVDICRGILVCDLSQVEHKPWLRYVPLPHRLPARAPRDGPRFSRDIAVVDGHFKYVRQTISSGGGWTCQTFTRPVVVDGNCWVPVCSMDSSNMDVQGFHHLLPRLEDDDDEGRHLPPLEGFEVWLPVLSLDTDCNTICLMVWNTSVVWNDAKAWVLAVDLKNSRLQGVSQFDPSRYRMVGIAYEHSRISGYLKRAQGKNENPGSSNKKVGGGGDMPLD